MFGGLEEREALICGEYSTDDAHAHLPGDFQRGRTGRVRAYCTFESAGEPQSTGDYQGHVSPAPCQPVSPFLIHTKKNQKPPPVCELQQQHHRTHISITNSRFLPLFKKRSETATIMPHLPSYLASTHYRNPSDPENSFFGYANNTSQNMFEWLETRPEQLRIFTEYQSATAELSLYSLRPLLEEFLSKDVDEDGDGEGERPVLFVDVGGGRGTTLREVCRSLQPLKGRVVLQDLLKVVEGVEGAEADEVEVMAHDFLKKQPVKGMFCVLSFFLSFFSLPLSPYFLAFPHFPPSTPTTNDPSTHPL